jgi:hypothetical protein
MKPRELEAYRKLLEDVISSLGREEVAVGETRQADDKLQFSLIKGHHTYHAELPLAVLAEPKQVKVAVNAILTKLVKLIEREHADATKEAA